MDRMTSYLIRRLLQFLPTIFLIILLTFVLLHLAPGDPAWFMAGEFAGEEYVNFLREKYGLNKPLHEQLLIYLSNIFRGDLGYSLIYNKPVLSLISERVLPTFLLIFTAQIFAVIIGTLLGTCAAKNYGSKIDIAISTVSTTLYSLPIFWVGLLLVSAFSVHWRIFPVLGMTTPAGGLTGISYILDVLHHLFLPALCLWFYYVTFYIRLSRASVIEVLRSDFITTARSMGLPEKKVVYGHALRNAIIPTVTMIGLSVGRVLGGAILTESVFAWPGMGRLMYESVIRRDYPTLMGASIFSSIITVVACLIVDVIYVRLDPRISYRDEH